MNNIIIFLFSIFIVVLLGLVLFYPTIKEVVYIRRIPKLEINALPADELILVSGKAEQAGDEFLVIPPGRVLQQALILRITDEK